MQNMSSHKRGSVDDSHTKASQMIHRLHIILYLCSIVNKTPGAVPGTAYKFVVAVLAFYKLRSFALSAALRAQALSGLIKRYRRHKLEACATLATRKHATRLSQPVLGEVCQVEKINRSAHIKITASAPIRC